MRLTRSSGEANGLRYGIYEWEGKPIRVFDDAQNGLLLIDLFADETIDAEAKASIVPLMLFPDPESVGNEIEDVSGLLDHLLWEVAGLDITGTRDCSGERVIDWEADAAAIRDSLWMTYGVGFDELRCRVTLRELCDMLCHCPHETPMGQALYYRTAEEPAMNEHNRAYVEDFRRKREHWRLDRNPKEDMRTMDQRADAVFDSLWKGAADG